MLGRYRIPVAMAVAQRGARGESEKAVGSSQGRQLGCSWHLAGTASAWQPGESGLGLATPFSWRCAAQRRAARTCCYGGERTPGEEVLLRGVFLQNQQTAKSLQPGTLVWVHGAPFQTRRQGVHLQPEVRLQDRQPTAMLWRGHSCTLALVCPPSVPPTLLDTGRKASGVSRHQRGRCLR